MRWAGFGRSACSDSVSTCRTSRVTGETRRAKLLVGKGGGDEEEEADPEDDDAKATNVEAEDAEPPSEGDDEVEICSCSFAPRRTSSSANGPIDQGRAACGHRVTQSPWVPCDNNYNLNLSFPLSFPLCVYPSTLFLGVARFAVFGIRTFCLPCGSVSRCGRWGGGVSDVGWERAVVFEPSEEGR